MNWRLQVPVCQEPPWGYSHCFGRMFPRGTAPSACIHNQKSPGSTPGTAPWSSEQTIEQQTESQVRMQPHQVRKSLTSSYTTQCEEIHQDCWSRKVQPSFQNAWEALEHSVTYSIHSCTACPWGKEPYLRHIAAGHHLQTLHTLHMMTIPIKHMRWQVCKDMQSGRYSSYYILRIAIGGPFNRRFEFGS